jgi:ABC-type antimicrobial peptide transport system permease subunit
VVGVARDVNFISLTAPVLPYVWIPALQMARPPLFHIGSQGDPRVLITPIQEILREVAPGWAVNSASTMEDRVSSALFAERAAGASIALFAMIALLLAAVGLGGVIAYAVTQRTREVGIRVALGAVPRGVLALFLRQALPVVAIGAGIGLILAFITARTLSGLLIGVGATDLVTFVAAAGLLCATALLATWLPARRAVRVDPMIALRSE